MSPKTKAQLLSKAPTKVINTLNQLNWSKTSEKRELPLYNRLKCIERPTAPIDT